MSVSLSSYFTRIGPYSADSTYRPQYFFDPVTADLNQDGYQDLILLGASYPIGSVTQPSAQPGRVLFGDGNGGFTPAESDVFPTESLKTVHPRKVMVADFNADGQQDIFISNHGWDTNPFPGEQNQLYLSNGDGTWRDATNTLPQKNDYSHSSSIGDIDGDGDIDIFVGNGYAGQNGYLSYTLINNGAGAFTSVTSNIPLTGNSPLNFNTDHRFNGSTLADLDGDGRSDLIIDSNKSSSFDANVASVVLWNNGGSFSSSNMTVLPRPSAFNLHIDLDSKPIDFNKDGKTDLIMIGTQENPFYDGWFVQILQNNGDRTFSDVTSSALSAADRFGGVSGVDTNSPWLPWVNVIDFNNDGWLDFAVEVKSGGHLSQTMPLVWLNDGEGHFNTLKVSDFVAPGDEWQLGDAHLVQTSNGFSFVTPQIYPGSNGLQITGLLATTPIDILQVNAAPAHIQELGRLYEAGLGRAFDEPGLNYWIDQREAGMSLWWIAWNFLESAEFNRLSGDDDVMSNSRFLEVLYNNVLDRQPDPSGFAWWLDQMNNGYSHEDALISFANSAENKAQSTYLVGLHETSSGYWAL